MKRYLTLLTVVCLAFAVGCGGGDETDKSGCGDKAGCGDGGGGAGDALKDLGDKAGDAVKDAANKAGDAVDKATQVSVACESCGIEKQIAAGATPPS